MYVCMIVNDNTYACEYVCMIECMRMCMCVCLYA